MPKDNLTAPLLVLALSAIQPAETRSSRHPCEERTELGVLSSHPAETGPDSMRAAN